MKRGVGILAASALMLSFAACGGDDVDPCEAGTSAALSAFPSRASGTLTLVHEETTIEVPVTARAQTSSSDECALSLTLVQHSQDLCGSEFGGVLNYSSENERWEGSLVQVDVQDGESPTKMDVHYALRDNGQVVAWNKMVESPVSLCQDKVIDGTLRPQ